jgi:hypothetical protein
MLLFDISELGADEGEGSSSDVMLASFTRSSPIGIGHGWMK